MNEQPIYETPAIVFEGDLEIQAGSPLVISPDFENFESFDW